MYHLINKHIAELLDSVNLERDITPYLELMMHLRKHEPLDDVFKRRYRKYWNMTRVQVTAAFDEKYFEELQRLNGDKGIAFTVEKVERSLRAHTERGGRKSVQFSFATKLVHMLDPKRPVFDSNVSAFFFLSSPPATYGPERKLQKYVQLYDFLRNEYARIVKMRLLDQSISEFRRQFPIAVHDYTNEKIIDTLIWRFVPLLRSQSVGQQFIHYS